MQRWVGPLVCALSLGLTSPVALRAQNVPPDVPSDVRVLAAGSLRAALTDSAAAFEAATPGVRLQLGFGASGLLKDRILAGEPADVFASANMDHPGALAAAGRAGPVQRFARNALCTLVRPRR